ncbi:hypothetical protein FPSE_10263 [Fusarium pseudograminearum CS3096]|uniref:Uncharacterized protein n=1 Tax=Fusarium pseudograminearum (strain CS3096) TaxID=1028729 RepID=K3V7M8_FUSPC|nr:hypothetical protein FPSE_10263 [Fusarium pseudograminearum CS3096]EKJ69552.1 hypothetical protein FPSE_10263 [Fusarium pseudograminearum CS3096]
MDGKKKSAIDAKPNPHIFTVVSQQKFTCQRQTVLLVQSNKKYTDHVSNCLDQKSCIEKKRLEEEELRKKKNKGS